MDFNEDDNSPLAGAVRFWDIVRDDDAATRNLLGGLLHPMSRQRPEQIQQDFDSLDRPALAARLEESSDPSVFYARIVEGAETVGSQIVESLEPSRFLTLKWVDVLNYWAVYHYGGDRVRSSVIPN